MKKRSSASSKRISATTILSRLCGPYGIYVVELPNLPFEAYYTVADGYAYVTGRERENLTRLGAGRVGPAARRRPGRNQ